MTNDKRKLLQEALSNEGWPVLEEFVEEYINNLNLPGSIRRNDEFNTIWDRAFTEGGEYHIRELLKQLDSEARKFI